MERTVGEWIDSGRAFVMFREPGDSLVRAVSARSEALQRLTDMSGLRNKDGFVFAPFKASENCPLWLLPIEEERRFTLSHDYDDVPEAPAPVTTEETLCDQPSEHYAQIFQTYQSALKAHEFDKLVLARRQTVGKPSGFSWAKAFGVACRRYVHSYVYLFYTPQTGFWLGATPEILLSGGKGRFRTVALAGTQVLSDEVRRPEWSEKNRYEQQLVADFIADVLQTAGIKADTNGPMTITAGSLAHLKTEFCFELRNPEQAVDLLCALHPTPAVCGAEKVKAYEFISSHEDCSRAYYSGFLGRWNPNGTTSLYVNLRCMSGDINGTLSLYAGGGLLAVSKLEEEWMETERKLQTMKYVIEKCIQIKEISCN